MSDLISRQAVSDIIKTRLYQTALNNTECITSYDKVCEDIADNRIDTWINEAKSVEPEKCGDCISRQAAIDGVFALCDPSLGEYKENPHIDAVYELLDSLPSVEPDGKKGLWLKRTDKTKKLYGWYQCSQCGAIIGEPTNYCSECGARMEVDNG